MSRRPNFAIYGSRSARAQHPNGRGATPSQAAAMVQDRVTVIRRFPTAREARASAAGVVRALQAAEGGAPTMTAGTAQLARGGWAAWAAPAGGQPSLDRLAALLGGRP